MSRIYINKKFTPGLTNKNIVITSISSTTNYQILYYNQEIDKCLDNLYNRLISLSEEIIEKIINNNSDNLNIDFEKNEAIIKC